MPGTTLTIIRTTQKKRKKDAIDELRKAIGSSGATQPATGQQQGWMFKDKLRGSKDEDEEKKKRVRDALEFKCSNADHDLFAKAFELYEAGQQGDDGTKAALEAVERHWEAFTTTIARKSLKEIMKKQEGEGAQDNDDAE